MRRWRGLGELRLGPAPSLSIVVRMASSLSEAVSVCTVCADCNFRCTRGRGRMLCSDVSLEPATRMALPRIRRRLSLTGPFLLHTHTTAPLLSDCIPHSRLVLPLIAVLRLCEAKLRSAAQTLTIPLCPSGAQDCTRALLSSR